VLPSYSLDNETVAEIKDGTRRLARELGVKGLINIQYAVKGGDIYVLEVNPRASRTVPFLSKATGLPLAKIATKVMTGLSLREQNVMEDPIPKYFSVKESVLPFNRFPGVDIILGPEMKSTGEVMGIDPDMGIAYAKSQIAAGQMLPESGKIFISVKDSDKPGIIEIGKQFAEIGFEILSTFGTAKALTDHGIPVSCMKKLNEGRPNILDYIKNRTVEILINTPSGPRPRRDEVTIRSVAVAYGIPVVTTLSGAAALAKGIKALKAGVLNVRSLKEFYSFQENCPFGWSSEK
jgi:carbamoyl-phosphate synthase large subunit